MNQTMALMAMLRPPNNSFSSRWPTFHFFACLPSCLLMLLLSFRRSPLRPCLISEILSSIFGNSSSSLDILGHLPQDLVFPYPTRPAEKASFLSPCFLSFYIGCLAFPCSVIVRTHSVAAVWCQPIMFDLFYICAFPCIFSILSSWTRYLSELKRETSVSFLEWDRVLGDRIGCLARKAHILAEYGSMLW